MKLKKLMLPLMALAMLVSGCTKEYVTFGSQVETFRFNVTPSQWQQNKGEALPGADNYLYCTLDVPAINGEVFDRGTVQAYVWNVYDVANNLGAWNPLPFVYPLELLVDNEEGGQSWVIVPENLRYEWEQGKVTLIIQDLDGYDPASLAQTLSFKICVTHNL